MTPGEALERFPLPLTECDPGDENDFPARHPGDPDAIILALLHGPAALQGRPAPKDVS